MVNPALLAKFLNEMIAEEHDVIVKLENNRPTEYTQGRIDAYRLVQAYLRGLTTPL